MNITTLESLCALYAPTGERSTKKAQAQMLERYRQTIQHL
jgi:hypothetical protein